VLAVPFIFTCKSLSPAFILSVIKIFVAVVGSAGKNAPPF
jgi:hypothetical protein